MTSGDDTLPVSILHVFRVSSKLLLDFHNCICALIWIRVQAGTCCLDSNGIPTTARELVALDSKKKMSNFERAILENRIARCHMHDLRAYLVHFGKDFARYFLQGVGAPAKALVIVLT